MGAKAMNENLYYETLNKEFKAIFKEIKNAPRIVIFRHEVPDFDALGTQMGLYQWIVDSFPGKEVHYVGEGFHSFTPRIFPNPEVLNEDFYKTPYLAIVVDTPTKNRISGLRLDNAYKLIRFDHHPMVEQWGDLISVHPESAACAELVCLMILSIGHKYPLSKEAARYFYIGIVGDSGRFRYPEVTPLTLRIGADLLQTGIDKEAIYSQMYLETVAEFNFQKWVLTHYTISAKGTAYYVIEEKDLEALNIVTGDGKLGLDLFRDVEGIDCCVSLTYDKEKHNYRLSFRSEKKPVSQVAALFNGGGHLFAAGGNLDDIKKLPDLIKALDELAPVEKA
jgi:phosphoesterase RecJ-like protein